MYSLYQHLYHCTIRQFYRSTIIIICWNASRWILLAIKTWIALSWCAFVKTYTYTYTHTLTQTNFPPHKQYRWWFNHLSARLTPHTRFTWLVYKMMTALNSKVNITFAYNNNNNNNQRQLYLEGNAKLINSKNVDSPFAAPPWWWIDDD